MDFFEKTNADKNSIGFTYQDYVALKHALELKPEEHIGIEVYDDLHLESIEGHKTLVEPRQPGGCKLKTAPVRPVVAARPAEYVCSE
ncbi:hypothetical protein LHK82_25025, partial [Escherichia coli]|nr:hypothetical protein [Escherichia coli]